MSLIHLLSRLLIDRERKDWRESVTVNYFSTSLATRSLTNRIFDLSKRSQSRFSPLSYCTFSRHRNDFPFFLPRRIIRRKGWKEKKKKKITRRREVVFINYRTKKWGRDDRSLARFKIQDSLQRAVSVGGTLSLWKQTGVGDRVFDIGAKFIRALLIKVAAEWQRPDNSVTLPRHLHTPTLTPRD